MPRKSSKPVVGESVSLDDLSEFQATALSVSKGSDPLEEILKDEAAPESNQTQTPLSQEKNQKMSDEAEYYAIDMDGNSNEIDNGFKDEPEFEDCAQCQGQPRCSCSDEKVTLLDQFLANEEVDWEAYIPKEYFLTTESGQRLVKVQGLYDLLHKVGFQEFMSKMVHVSPGIIIVESTLVISNGGNEKIVKALAEATTANCGEPPFDSFLAAIADTRAKGRAIRQMFNVRATVEEELDPKTRKEIKQRVAKVQPSEKPETQEPPKPKPASISNPSAKATQKQVDFIGLLLKKNELTPGAFIQRHPEMDLPVSPDADTNPLSLLTVEKASKLIAFLNDPKSKK